MRKFKLKYIQDFLTSHGWILAREGNLFYEYSPPSELGLDGYVIDIPKDENDSGFEKYMNTLVDIVVDVYGDRFTNEDIKTFFQTENNVFAIRIAGTDTALGSLQLSRFRSAVNSFYQSLRQSVVYAVTQRPIFGQAKGEANSYLRICRSKQTAFGSYILKFELPENNLTLFEEKSVPDILYNALDFIVSVSEEFNESDITEEFVQNYSEIINIELLESLVKLIKDSKLYEGEIQLHSTSKSNQFGLKADKQKIKKMERMVAEIKEILLKRIPLEVQGLIIRLASKEVEQTGKIIMEVEIGEEWYKLEVVLQSDNYKRAVEAHKNGREVYVKGIAQELRNKYLIEELNEFYVI